MFNEIIKNMEVFFVGLATQYGYLGIFLGSFADSIFPLVPSEAVLGLTGVLVGKGVLSGPVALLVSVFGNLSASVILYYCGKIFGTKFIDKFGKFMSFDRGDLTMAQAMFSKRGYFAVLYCQFVPLLRSLISIPSGLLNLSLPKFLLATGAGAIVWNSTLIYIGYTLNDKYDEIGKLVAKFGYPLMALSFVVIGGLLWYYIKKIKSLKKLSVE
jgi:membrane protein DedA with SNARE-associated domain